MVINNYEELEDAIELYCLNGDEKLLINIRNFINENECIRKKILGELKYKVYYINFFSEQEQVEIIENIIRKIKVNKDFTFETNELLLYASDDVRKKVLSSTDKSVINIIIDSIRTNIVLVMLTRKFSIKATYNKYFEALKMKKSWKRLYKLCKQYV